jgi:hypothetical protein
VAGVVGRGVGQVRVKERGRSEQGLFIGRISFCDNLEEQQKGAGLQCNDRNRPRRGGGTKFPHAI